MIDQNNIRQEINSFCLNHVFNGSNSAITMGQIPAAIIVYLGSQSRTELDMYMKSAFASMLKVEPHVKYICLNEENIGDAAGFVNQIVTAMRELSQEGCLMSNQMINLQVSYVAMMDDPLLSNVDLAPSLAAIKEEIDRLQNTNIVRLNASAFYGIFNQDKNKAVFDYTGTFANVRAGSGFGSNIWPRVYHLQKTILQESFESCARTVAVSLLNDVMFPDTNSYMADQGDASTYCWRYLGLDELKIPEQIICNILINAYNFQVSNEPFRTSEREEFRKNLEQTFMEEIESKCDIFIYPEFVRYMPRNIENMPAAEQSSGGGLFGMFKKKAPVERSFQSDFAGWLVSENEIDTILTEYAKDLVHELEQPEVLVNIFRKAIGRGVRIDSVVPRMREVILEETERLLAEIGGKINQIHLNGIGNTEAEYFRSLFDRYAEKEKYETIQEVLAAYMTDGNRRDVLGKALIDALHGIVSDCNDRVNALNNIRVNVYGGSNAIHLGETAADFHVGIDVPVQQSCMMIPRPILNKLVEDERMLKDNATNFITQAINNSINRNSIGQIAGTYSADNQIAYTLLLNLPLENNNMRVNKSSLFRENTMMILSTCKWDSVENLAVYFQRGV